MQLILPKEQLKDWRYAAGLSQEKAARALDVSFFTYRRWEIEGVPILRQPSLKQQLAEHARKNSLQIGPPKNRVRLIGGRRFGVAEKIDYLDQVEDGVKFWGMSGGDVHIWDLYVRDGDRMRCLHLKTIRNERPTDAEFEAAESEIGLE